MSENLTQNEAEFKSNIKIADDVIGSIAVLAAADVEGVAGMAGSTGDDIATWLGGKNARKGIKTVVNDEEVGFSLAINVKYGSSIPDVCRRVQDKVSTTVTNMTGFKVNEVNVTIAGIEVPENA